MYPSHTLSGWGPPGSENIPPTVKQDEHVENIKPDTVELNLLCPDYCETTSACLWHLNASGVLDC